MVGTIISDFTHPMGLLSHLTHHTGINTRISIHIGHSLMDDRHPFIGIVIRVVITRTTMVVMVPKWWDRYSGCGWWGWGWIRRWWWTCGWRRRWTITTFVIHYHHTFILRYGTTRLEWNGRHGSGIHMGMIRHWRIGGGCVSGVGRITLRCDRAYENSPFPISLLWCSVMIMTVILMVVLLRIIVRSKAVIQTVFPMSMIRCSSRRGPMKDTISVSLSVLKFSLVVIVLICTTTTSSRMMTTRMTILMIQRMLKRRRRSIGHDTKSMSLMVFP